MKRGLTWLFFIILKDYKAITAIKVKDDGGSNQNGSDGKGGKQAGSRYIFMAESTGFPDILGIRYTLYSVYLQDMGRADYIAMGVYLSFVWNM